MTLFKGQKVAWSSDAEVLEGTGGEWRTLMRSCYVARRDVTSGSGTMGGQWPEADTEFMREALGLAGQAEAAGEVPVGAVVTVGGRAAGRGFNRNIVDRDPTAHAEMLALREAARQAGNHRLSDATVYVTLEPCVMCVGAMLHARIRRLVFGTYDPKGGVAGSVYDLCDDRRLNHRIEVNGGLLEQECMALLQRFFAAKRP